jgi:hypothetical protein
LFECVIELRSGVLRVQLRLLVVDISHWSRGCTERLEASQQNASSCSHESVSRSSIYFSCVANLLVPEYCPLLGSVQENPISQI